MSDVWKQETLKSGDLELIILPGIGGRLWDVVFQGRSLLFHNSDLKSFIPDITNLRGFPTRSPQFGFPLWGGEKTWIAPDTKWPDGAPYAALDSGPYEIAGGSKAHITLQSVVCRQSKLQITRELRIIDGATWSIQHTVTNHGRHDRDVGIWSVMMLNHKARIGVTSQDLTPTKVFGDPDGFLSTHNAGIVCDCNERGEFKVGIENRSAHTLIRLDHDDKPVWMSCDTPPPTPADRFAHIHPLEVFNSGDYPYCEAEWHAPLQTLSPGAKTEFGQRFAVWTDPTTQDLNNSKLELMKCMS